MPPFLLVNSGSGGGTHQAGILAAAADLGLTHHVAEPGDDFTAVLERAVADGADVLAAAGGDGTLSATADVAMAHGVPMVVVPAGTRNHFALDLGLDADDPAQVLRASLTAGYSRRVDVGSINGSTFLNNVSLGLYAAAVGRHGYREHKRTAFLAAAHDALHPDRGQTLARLVLPAPGTGRADPTRSDSGRADSGRADAAPGPVAAAVLVVNNAYMPTFAPGRRLRGRLDGGEVWVYVGGGPERHEAVVTRMWHAADAAVHATLFHAAFGTSGLRIDADRPDIPVAVDGELRPDLTAPFTVACRAGGLRLLVPSDPGPGELGLTLVW